MGGLCWTLLLQSTPELPPAGLGFGAALLKMVAALVLVCVLAYLALRLARRHLTAVRGAGSLLRVVDRCPLAGRQSLWIVAVGERYFLIGASDGHISRLAELDPDQVRQVEEQPRGQRSFLDVLKKGPGPRP